jgi:molecular chaperone Hsp33
MDPAPDSLERFLLRDAPVRGEIVSLDAAWRQVVERHDLPACVRDRLGELAAAALLLTATLKFDGTMVLQIHGDGPLALLVVECDASGRFRATVKMREGAEVPEDADLRALVNVGGRGRFAVTLEPREREPGQQPYQGIVPFEGETVAEVLEHYMQRSEQLPTRLWLAADGERACGLLLQRLPEEGGRAAPPAQGPRDDDGWPRLCQLADTLERGELLGLPPAQVLHRLFWQERLHAFDRRGCSFGCRCSREKVGAMLRMLGREEIASILEERGTIEVRCEFCNLAYDFDAVDSAWLFTPTPPHVAPDRSQ